nr:NUDIX domain-containing protein [Corynebacterium crudilactis]
MSPSSAIRIAAVVFQNENYEVLSVRKAGTSAFMLPGGKLELGELPQAAAIREVAEELHIALEPASLSHLGRFQAQAANEAGRDVDCDVFIADIQLHGIPPVYEEIVEAAYFPLDSHSPKLAPLSLQIFPQL